MKKMLSNKVRGFFALLNKTESEMTELVDKHERDYNAAAVTVGIVVSAITMGATTKALIAVAFLYLYLRLRVFKRYIYPHRRAIICFVIACILLHISMKLSIALINHGTLGHNAAK